MRCVHYASAAAAVFAGLMLRPPQGLLPFCACRGFTISGTPDRRVFSTTACTYESKMGSPRRLGMDGFTDVAYNAAADTFLDAVDAALEAIDTEAVEDVNLSGGVLVIETVSRGTFVLNKQAPNVQLWLSSPLSGPHHYDMKTTEEGEVEWFADTDGHKLRHKLEEELSEVLGVAVKLG